jgi:hypothetical protein
MLEDDNLVTVHFGFVLLIGLGTYTLCFPEARKARRFCAILPEDVVLDIWLHSKRSNTQSLCYLL